MENIKEPKKEAYKITTERYGDGYNYSGETKAEVMKAYGMLIMAELLKNDNERVR